MFFFFFYQVDASLSALLQTQYNVFGHLFLHVGKVKRLSNIAQWGWISHVAGEIGREGVCLEYSDS